MKRRASYGLQRELRKNWDLYLVLLIVTAYFFVFSYLPMLGIQIAFRDYKPSSGYWDSPWVGLKHFRTFFNSFRFQRVLTNTLTISLYDLLVSFPIPIILALSINEVTNKIFKGCVQNISYIPHFLSNVVIVGMIQTLVAADTGLVNRLVELFGGQPIMFLLEPKWFQTVYVFTKVWQQTGWSSIIYLAALSGVDPSLYESAVIDGASILQKIRHINLPHLQPTIVVLLLMNLGRIMSVGYERIYLLQNDLNLSTSEIISTYVYRSGILQAEYSFSTAVGLFNSLINVVLLVSANFISRKINEASLW